MKLCSQCQFIYEDDQDRCDMDGAELVYEPTLEHFLENKAIEAEPKQPGPLKIVIPLAAPPQPQVPVVSSKASSRRRKFAWQIAAVILIAVVAFTTFYATKRWLQPKAEASTKLTETHNTKFFSSAIGSAAAIPVESAGAAEPSASPLPIETRYATPESKTAPAAGIKPLPRLKPLPTLKPLPRLSEETRRMTANQKSVVITAKPKPEAKKESRLGSFLKKTGRVLTKPFKT